jgi:glycosyltransferase involved in cell wall biosynthesis
VLVVEHGDGLWGAQRYLLRLAPLMASRGVDQILAAPADSQLAAHWRAAGGTHVALPVPVDRSIRGAGGRLSPWRAAREASRTVGGAWTIARLARRLRVDGVQANSHWSHLEAAVGGRLARRPTVLHLHEQSQRDALGRLRALAISIAPVTIAVSSAVRRSLPAATAGRVTVVPNGIDTVAFAPGPVDPVLRAELSDDPTAPVVLVVARVEPCKGIADVIKAVHRLPPDLGHTRLAIAGDAQDPTYQRTLLAMGEELLGPRLRLLGVRDDVDRLMRCADALVLASEAEGFGLCVAEAQASGLPVVAYPAGGVAEVIEHGVTGLLARQGDVDDLAGQLGLLLSEPMLAKEISLAARDRICAEGSLERQADAHARILRDLLAAGRRTHTGRHTRTRGQRLVAGDYEGY